MPSRACDVLQLEGRLGGEALSGLVSIKDVDKSRKAWARGGKRLLEALQRGPKSQHLALPLFILVAQQRQAIMVRDPGWPAGAWSGEQGAHMQACAGAGGGAPPPFR